MKTIADHYKTFSALVVPPGASPREQADVRMAFFGGATAMLTLVTQAAAKSGDSDDVGATIIAQLHQEVRDFTSRLGGGHA